jgi:hypothetical protein
MTIGSNERMSGKCFPEPARPCPGTTIVACKRVRGYSRLPREAWKIASTLLARGRDAMPLITEITVSQLSRLVGLADAPTIIDVRIDARLSQVPRRERRDAQLAQPQAKGLR